MLGDDEIMLMRVVRMWEDRYNVYEISSCLGVDVAFVSSVVEEYEGIEVEYDEST